MQLKHVGVAVLVSALLSGCSAITDLLPIREVTVTPVASQSKPVETAQPTLTWQQVLETTRASVVRVQTSSCEQSTVLGSGFVVGDNLVMTAAHVVDDGRTAAILVDGRIVKATLVGLDHSSDTALLRTDRGLGVPSLQLVADGPSQGSELAVLGFPLRMTEVAISEGIVSALHQTADYGYFKVDDTFITNAETNRGNSGGPVMDRRARVIGLVSGGRAWDGSGAAAIPVQGMNFIIPSPALAADLARWRASVPQGFAECASDEEPIAPESAELEMTINSDHADAQAIAATLFVHGQSINEGSYESAWRVFTPAMKTRMKDLDRWSQGLSTSYWRAVAINTLTRSGATATAEVDLKTEQQADAGFGGQTCSIHRMRYQFVLSDGVWLIDTAQRPSDPVRC